MTMLRGHGAVMKNLQDHLSLKKAGQTYIFSGPKGVGKSMVAHRFVHAFLKEAPLQLHTPQDSVWSRMQAGTHGNFKVIEEDTTTAHISIDSLRHIIPFFMQSSFEPGGRAVIIDSCEALTPQAANSLLKLLEEPPRGCLIILINHQPHKLLPTLKSRGHSIHFCPLNEADLMNLCELYEWNQEFMTLAMGSPGLLKLLSHGLSPDLYNKFIKGINHLNQSFSYLFSFLEAFMQTSQDTLLPIFQAFIGGWFHEQILLKIKGEGHALYASISLKHMISRWFYINQLCHEAMINYLEVKQTMTLVLKALDPKDKLPSFSF